VRSVCVRVSVGEEKEEDERNAEAPEVYLFAARSMLLPSYGCASVRAGCPKCKQGSDHSDKPPAKEKIAPFQGTKSRQRCYSGSCSSNYRVFIVARTLAQRSSSLLPAAGAAHSVARRLAA
jgi:hypothetical protein